MMISETEVAEEGLSCQSGVCWRERGNKGESQISRVMGHVTLIWGGKNTKLLPNIYYVQHITVFEYFSRHILILILLCFNKRSLFNYRKRKLFFMKRVYLWSLPKNLGWGGFAPWTPFSPQSCSGTPGQDNRTTMLDDRFFKRNWRIYII